MKSCLNAATLRQGLGFEEFVRVAGQAGFRGVELRIASALEHAQANGLAGLRRLFDQAGVAPAGFGYPASLMRPAESWADDLRAVPAAAELAAELGVPGGMTVLPFRRDGVQVTDRAEMVDKLGQLADLAARSGRELYLEFIGLHPPAEQRGDFVQTIPDALALAREIGRPNVGLVVDAYHWFLRGTPEQLDAIPAGTPIFCHIDDAPAGERSGLTDPMRVLPGQGVIDLPGFLAALRRTGWDGYVSVELFNEALRAMEPLEAARQARRSLDHLGVE